MVFHSLHFLVFFSLFVAGLPFFRGPVRIYYVTVFSYFFYGFWYPPYVVLLFGLTLFAYVTALVCRPSRSRLLPALACCIAPLCFYKYSHFVLDNANALFGSMWKIEGSWVLPLGISFITFTAMSYLIEVLSGRLPA